MLLGRSMMMRKSRSYFWKAGTISGGFDRATTIPTDDAHIPILPEIVELGEKRKATNQG
jgi:hypothetical protein